MDFIFSILFFLGILTGNFEDYSEDQIINSALSNQELVINYDPTAASFIEDWDDRED